VAVVILKIKRVEKCQWALCVPEAKKTEPVMGIQPLDNTYINSNDATYESASLHTQGHHIWASFSGQGQKQYLHRLRGFPIQTHLSAGQDHRWHRCPVSYSANSDLSRVQINGKMRQAIGVLTKSVFSSTVLCKLLFPEFTRAKFPKSNVL
jgi:hypothetical protein